MKLTGVNKIILHKTLTFLIASVWIINGLFAKVLNFVPRHQEIVSNILGELHAAEITKIIGILEILMAFWVLSRIKPKLCTISQILIVGTMNIIEFLLVPELLLFGRVNIIIAAVFILVVYYNEFRLLKNH